MSGRARIIVPALLAIVVVIAGTLLGGGVQLDGRPGGTDAANASPAGGSTAPDPATPLPTPTERPALGGTELYGYVPYWQMTDSMAGYLEHSPVSTLLLFSVTARRSGALNETATGYRRITGRIGQRLIDDAHRTCRLRLHNESRCAH